MVRKPARKAARSSSAAKPAAPVGAGSEREKIIAAFLALLAEKPIEQIGFAGIAKEAGVSLGQLRGEFASTLAILAAHIKEDRPDRPRRDLTDMGDEPPRERLFDVLMRRLEMLAPHARRFDRCSVRRAATTARLGAQGARLRSQQWMLTAADISAAGPRGAVRAQGLALLFGSVLRTWVRDDDDGHARTMAALDRALARRQRLSGFLDDLCFIPSRLCRLRPRRRRRDATKKNSAVA